MPSVTHRIRILSAPGGYSTTRTVSLKCASNPMRCVAVALLDQGRDPSDRLQGVWEGAQISPGKPRLDSQAASAPRSDLPMAVLNAA